MNDTRQRDQVVAKRLIDRCRFMVFCFDQGDIVTIADGISKTDCVEIIRAMFNYIDLPIQPRQSRALGEFISGMSAPRNEADSTVISSGEQ